MDHSGMKADGPPQLGGVVHVPIGYDSRNFAQVGDVL